METSGWVERTILQRLTTKSAINRPYSTRPFQTRELSLEVAQEREVADGGDENDAEVTDSDRASVRRALYNLEEKGLVKRGESREALVEWAEDKTGWHVDWLNEEALDHQIEFGDREPEDKRQNAWIATPKGIDEAIELGTKFSEERRKLGKRYGLGNTLPSAKYG